MEYIPNAFSTSSRFVAVFYILLCIFQLGVCKNRCPDDEKAHNDPEYLTSVYYPNMYKPDLDCEWRIQSEYPNKKVKIQMIDMEIEYDDECQFDYLEVFDGYDDNSPSFGRYCGKDAFTIVGSGIYLYFHFHTDSEINLRGFKLSYRTVSFTTVSSSYPPPIGLDKKDKPSESDKKNESFGGAKLSTLVGGVLGGLCLLVVITAICCMCSTRICRRCTRRGNGRQRTSVSPQSSATDIRRRNRSRRHSPPQVSPFSPGRSNNNNQLWSLGQENFPMVPIQPPPYSETANQPVFLVEGVPEYNSYAPPSSPPPTYSFGLSSDSNPPAYDDDRNSPPNYVPYDESPQRY